MPEIEGRRARVLIVDDDEVLLGVVSSILGKAFDVDTARSSAEALEIVKRHPVEAAILDHSLSDGSTGLELLDALQTLDPTMAAVMLSGTIDIPQSVEAMKRGASDVMLKPPNFARLKASLAELVREVRTRRRLRAQSALIDDPYGLFDASAPMRALVQRVLRIAPLDMPILFRGESGTGKHALAQITHQLSRRHGGALHTFAGNSLASGSGASELRRLLSRGRPEHVTVLLRDVGDASDEALELVETLLQTQCRVILTSEVDLSERAGAGRFPMSVWQRLAPSAVTVPSLRERGDAAIDARVSFVVNRARFREGVGPVTMSGEALRLVRTLPWYGNVPELQSVIGGAFDLAIDAPVIDVEHIDAVLAARATPRSPVDGAGESPAQQWTLRAAEHRQILAVLAHTGNHITQSAQLLGITRSTLYRKLREFGITETPA